MYKLESVQHHLLRFLAFKNVSNMAFHDHSYHNISSPFLIHSVASVHRYFDIIYSFKIEKGLLISPDLSALFLRCNCGYLLWDGRSFLERQSRSNFQIHTAGCRLIREWNELPLELRQCPNLLPFKFLAK